MSLNKVYVDQETDYRLRALKARTGLTPNLLCRLGFCLSLSEPGIPELALYVSGQHREFNRYTLTGEWDPLFFALLRERLHQDGLDPVTVLEDQFRAHLGRGVQMLSQRVKSLPDLAQLVASVQHRHSQEKAHVAY